MSNQKKKGKKKGSAKASKSAPVLENEFEDSDTMHNDDDGLITHSDCVEISKLILSTGKQLSKTASAFLESFKSRCALSIGTALLTYYEVFVNIELDTENKFLSSRIVLLFLIYKSRDLEPSIKRKVEKSRENMLGHPFIDLFHSLMSRTYSPYSSNAEAQFVYRIFTRGSNNVAHFLPFEIIKSMPDASISDSELNRLSDVIHHKSVCQETWPPGASELFSIPACINHILPIKWSYFTLDTLTRLGKKLLCTELPSMPSSNTRLWENIGFFPLTSEEVEHNPRDNKAFVSELNFSQVLKTLESKLKGSDSDDMDSYDEEEEEPTASSDKVTACIDKIYDGQTLSPSEQVILRDHILNGPSDSSYLNKIGPTFPFSQKFISDQIKIAAEVAKKLVRGDPELISDYVTIVMTMDVTMVQGMDLISRLYMSIPDLDTEILNDYIYHCLENIDRSEVSPSQQYRLIKTFCVVVRTLIQQGIITKKELITELKQFSLKHSQHKESSLLFQVLAEKSQTHL